MLFASVHKSILIKMQGCTRSYELTFLNGLINELEFIKAN